jgi:hypothetical protein
MQSEYYTEAGGENGRSALEEAGHLDFSAKYGNLEEPTFGTYNGRPSTASRASARWAPTRRVSK